MKKFTALILSLLCVLSFAGCNGSGKQNVSDQGSDSVITCNDPNCTDASHHHQGHHEDHHEYHHG